MKLAEVIVAPAGISAGKVSVSRRPVLNPVGQPWVWKVAPSPAVAGPHTVLAGVESAESTSVFGYRV